MRAELSPTEIKTLREIAEGHTQEHAARALESNIHTVKSRLVAIYRKLGANGVENAVALGHVAGYLDTPTEGAPNPRLPDEQIAMLALIGRGHERAEICQELTLTPHQVKYRLRAMYDTLEARSNCHLVHRGFLTRNLVIKLKQPEDQHGR